MLAVVWALHRLNTYLRGAPKIIVRTYHEALTFLKNCKFNNARLRRWNLSIQDFNICPEYLPGLKNSVADYLSRSGNSQIQDESEIVIAHLARYKPNPELVRAFQNIKELQKNDKFISGIIERLRNLNTATAKRYKYHEGDAVYDRKMD